MRLPALSLDFLPAFPATCLDLNGRLLPSGFIGFIIHLILPGYESVFALCLQELATENLHRLIMIVSTIGRAMPAKLRQFHLLQASRSSGVVFSTLACCMRWDYVSAPYCLSPCCHVHKTDRLASYPLQHRYLPIDAGHSKKILDRRRRRELSCQQHRRQRQS